MRILIIGGGIGGLALGAGLLQEGFDVVVHERDTDLEATGGYHITLDAAAQAALARLVPPGTLTRLLASAAANRLRDRDVIRDMRGRTLAHAPVKSTDTGVDLDRITLRLLLADAVGDALVRGSACTGVERRGDRVVARFADGHEEEGDVLVGADGVHSVVARALAGGETSTPAGLVGVCGRTPADGLGDAERARLGTRSGLSIGPSGTALYVGYLDPVGHAVLDAPELRASVTTGPTYIWGAMVPEGPDADRLRGLADGALADATVALLRRRGWDDVALEVLLRTQRQGVGLFRFFAGPQDARAMAPWPAGPITAIGDAVHATPPTAGMGAGAAIQDAADLLRALADVRDGRASVPVAVLAFEERMRERGAAVVRAGMGPVRWVLATDSTIGAAVTRAVLPLLAGVARLTRR